MQDQYDETEVNPFAKRSILVELCISEWNGQVKDLNVRDKVSSDNNANRSRLQVTKKLFGKGSLLHQINTLSSQIRAYKNDHTLQWYPSVGLLATSFFFDFKSEIDAMIFRWNGLVEKLCTGWEDQLQQLAHNNELGTLYNPDDYPTVDELRRKFRVTLNFMPVPQSGDFRVDIHNEELAQLRSHYDGVYKQKVEDVTREAWQKLYKLVKGMSDKLHADDVKRWHGSFISNASEMCEMLTHLNVGQDPELERARLELSQAMTGIDDIEVIKENEAVRNTLRKKLDTVLDSYGW